MVSVRQCCVLRVRGWHHSVAISECLTNRLTNLFRVCLYSNIYSMYPCVCNAHWFVCFWVCTVYTFCIILALHWPLGVYCVFLYVVVSFVFLQLLFKCVCFCSYVCIICSLCLHARICLFFRMCANVYVLISQLILQLLLPWTLMCLFLCMGFSECVYMFCQATCVCLQYVLITWFDYDMINTTVCENTCVWALFLISLLLISGSLRYLTSCVHVYLHTHTCMLFVCAY